MGPYHPKLTAFGIPLALGLQAQSRGCLKLDGVKGGLRKMLFVEKLVCVKAGWCKSWFVKVGWHKTLFV